MGIIVKDTIEIIDAFINDAEYIINKTVIFDNNEDEEYVIAEVVFQQLEKLRKRIKKVLVN